ncbi:MAG: ShlB/FhaC/HecB family hemolysin secretion/activation protein, partial [Methylococcales bacterium]|nr:ShlB/FhaC/HecB family hemolysin secretion/activation protein [Methylococcales bacterium]
QSLDFSQLQKLTDRISQHLKVKGWLLTKAYLPKQDVTEGNIQITITQGHLEIDEQGHSITIERAPGTRIDDDVIQERMRYIISGDTVQGDNLERTLLLLNDLPGIQAKTTLEKGKKTGTSRLGLNVNEGDLVKGTVSTDDTGSHYTGTWVGNLNVSVNDAFGKGEQFSIGGTGAENLGQGRVAFNMPIGYDGLQVNTRYSYLDYSVGRELKKLDSAGVAQSMGIGLSYPFIRSRVFSVWATADYTHKAMHDSSLKVITSQKQINNGKLGLNGQYLDHFFGGGLNQFSADTTMGNVDLSLPAEIAGDKATAGTQGTFGKHNFSLTRLQKITDSFSLYASANGQLADGNLSSAEKFILGGSSAVRAYPTGEASGDSGYVANFEMRYDVPYKTDIGTLQLVGFFDTGYIVQHDNRWKNDVTNKSGRNEYSLHGSGIGINFAHVNHFSIRGTWAHTVGENAGVSMAGNDSSGQHDDNRFLLNTLVSF